MELERIADSFDFQTYIDGKVVVYEFKTSKNTRRAKRQMQFYSAIARGKKVVYRASFWTRLKNWTRKLRLNYKEEETA